MYCIISEEHTLYPGKINLLGCLKSFVRFYESVLNRNISVNTYSNNQNKCHSNQCTFGNVTQVD